MTEEDGTQKNWQTDRQTDIVTLRLNRLSENRRQKAQGTEQVIQENTLKKLYKFLIIARPGVAGPVLQTAL